MKIKSIKDVNDNYCLYQVTFEPNFIERFFGLKEVTKEYKNTGADFVFGGGKVYLDQNGEKLSNGNWIGEAIDRYRRKW